MILPQLNPIPPLKKPRHQATPLNQPKMKPLTPQKHQRQLKLTMLPRPEISPKMLPRLQRLNQWRRKLVAEVVVEVEAAVAVEETETEEEAHHPMAVSNEKNTSMLPKKSCMILTMI
jgi:hypothetical protein